MWQLQLWQLKNEGCSTLNNTYNLLIYRYLYIIYRGVVPSRKTTVTTVICHTQSIHIHLKSRKSMRYDISKSKAPTMPALGRGTECIKILLSQVSKDNYEPFVPMFFPVLGAHISGAEFQYPDNSWKPFAPISGKAPRVPVLSCANGCVASLLPTPTRRDSTPRPTSTF